MIVFIHFSISINDSIQNQRSFIYFELPTTNFDIWENILSIICSQIKSLNITTNDFSRPLTYFTNIKSIIISSPYTILNESILDNRQLQNLHALTLTLEEFEDIFKLIELTPNLKYLKLQTSPPTNINIKLEQFYQTLTRK
jgi:hypothetical protein